jgi:hypothetical protein
MAQVIGVIFLVALAAVLLAIDRGVDSLARFFDDIDASLRVLREDFDAMPVGVERRKRP